MLRVAVGVELTTRARRCLISGRSPKKPSDLNQLRNLISALCLMVGLPCCSKRPAEPAMTTNDKSDENGLFLSWQHPNSRRYAILEQMDGMVWLYLTAPDSMKPDRDCPVFSTIPPADAIDWNLIEKTGHPPPMTKDVASATAIIARPVASEYDSFWSADGQSVAMVRGGQMICMIVAGAERGHSRALSKESPLGLPFDDALASRTFPEFRRR